jgi:hypothetical protein
MPGRLSIQLYYTPHTSYLRCLTNDTYDAPLAGAYPLVTTDATNYNTHDGPTHRHGCKQDVPYRARAGYHQAIRHLQRFGSEYGSSEADQIADRLCCAFGQDVLDTLFAKDTLAPTQGRRRRARPYFLFGLSLGYVRELPRDSAKGSCPYPHLLLHAGLTQRGHQFI